MDSVQFAEKSVIENHFPIVQICQELPDTPDLPVVIQQFHQKHSVWITDTEECFSKY